MLSKKLLVALLATVFGVAIAQEIQSGTWSDGTAIAWQCSTKASGTVKFIVTLPDGKKYAGMFSCGESI